MGGFKFTGLGAGTTTGDSLAYAQASANLNSLSLTTPLAIVNGGTGTTNPSLIGGTNINITGSWPNQTVAVASGATSMTTISAMGTGATTAGYIPVGGTTIGTVGFSGAHIPDATGAVYKNLFCALTNAPGVSASWVLTLTDNGSDQSLTCTMSGASATTCNDTLHTVTTAQGDLLAMHATITGSPVSTAIACQMEKDL